MIETPYLKLRVGEYYLGYYTSSKPIKKCAILFEMTHSDAADAKIAYYTGYNYDNPYKDPAFNDPAFIVISQPNLPLVALGPIGITFFHITAHEFLLHTLSEII